MNKKKLLLLLGVTLLFSIVIYKSYNDKRPNYLEAYILQVGAYKNYDNVVKTTKELDNYIIYKENDLYKIFIGVTADHEVFEKLERLYAQNRNVFKKTIKITNEDYEEELQKYDEIIINENNKENLNLIIKEELKELDKLLNENI